MLGVPDGSGGAVQFVFGVENEKDLEGFYQFGMRVVVSLVEVVQHVKEIFDVGESFLGHVVGPADAVAVGLGSNCGCAAQQTVDLFVAGLLVLVDVLSRQSRVGTGMHGAHGGHRRDEHAHRVRVVVETSHHRRHLSIFRLEHKRVMMAHKAKLR